MVSLIIGRQLVELCVFLATCHWQILFIYVYLLANKLIDCTAGLDKYSAAMIALIGGYIMPGADFAVSQAIAFMLFWMIGVSMSLFSRQMNVDGEGIHFNTAVFCWLTTSPGTANCRPTHANKQRNTER